MPKRLLSILFVLLLAFPGTAAAYSLSNPAPGFGSAQYQYLISDTMFTIQALNEDAINRFLYKQGDWTNRDGSVSWLAGYQIPEYQTIPYKYNDNGTCRWDSVSVRQFYDTGGEALYGTTAAALIARKSRDYSINPIVILTTLQKESSAITQSAPASDASQMWVLGYGWNDTMAACGYDASTARGRAVAYGGIGQQIAYSIALFRSKFDQYASSYSTPFTTSDGATIQAGNRATRALYSYTPYVYNGNYNFWYYSNRWFSPIPSFNPTLIRNSSTGAIYALVDGVRYPIDSMDTFNHLRFSESSVRPMTAEEEASTSVGPLLRRLLLDTGGGVSYLINGARHPIASARIFALRGFKWEDVSPPNLMAGQIPLSLPYYELAKIPDQNGVYIMTNGRGYAFPDPETFANDWGFAWDDFASTPYYTFAPYPLDGKVTRLVKGNGSAVYLMDMGRRLPIQSAAVFDHWALAWGDVNSFDDRFLGEFREGPVLTQLAKGSGPAVYLIKNGKKQPFSSASAFTRGGYQWGDITQVSDRILDTLSTGSAIR